jgi:molybdopterin molybdotransferase
MLSPEEALARVLTAITPPVPEEIPIEQACGRVLAEDVTASSDLPPWDNSAMDGFAVIAEDTRRVPVRLDIVEHIGAGQSPSVSITPGTCARIMTGAPMPEGADAVVMIERTDGGMEAVEIHQGVSPRQNVRDRGNDVSAGTVVLRSGRTLGPPEVGLLAGLGMPRVRVARQPRVAILSTGDEVMPVDVPLQPGQIHSSNTHALMGLVVGAGAIGVDCGIAPDDPAELQKYLARCVDEDLIVTTGGVSMGDHDHVKDAFDAHGAALDFWKIRMKPGKPLAFGSMGGKPAFGLPGNPVSCMVGFLQFVRPVIRGMLGDPSPFLPVVRARLTADVPKKPGRAEFCRVSLAEADGIQATPAANASSGAITSMVFADGFALLGEDCAGLAAGDEVSVQVLRWDWTGRSEPAFDW